MFNVVTKKVYHGRMLLMARYGTEFGPRLAKAREQAGLTQEEVALLVGQPRPVVSNWEKGIREPNAQQLTKLSAIYRRSLDELLGKMSDEHPQFEQLFFRAGGDRLDEAAKYQIQRFLGFLDDYGEFLEILKEPAGLTDPPLALREGRVTRDDVRRKAEEARTYFRLGDGPVGDLAAVADLNGITVYVAPLGNDLTTTVSGASFIHPRVGFSILVNGQTTPGRRQFTLAHEFGHALFHRSPVEISFPGRKEADERFADTFASEFLVPTYSLQATVESMGLSRVDDPETVVHLQRYFSVSYTMILNRLRASSLISDDDQKRFREIRPVRLAERLGYLTDVEEWEQDPDRSGLDRFPRRFLRLLRRASADRKITVGGAASMTGLAEEDIEELLRDTPFPGLQEDEYDEFDSNH
jgi:Zn-dependent peptidase ImmA (M78 family)/transcriptional regulator with XRE-family HTH domain